MLLRFSLKMIGRLKMTFCLFPFIHFQIYFQPCISDHISKNRKEMFAICFLTQRAANAVSWKQPFANAEIG